MKEYRFANIHEAYLGLLRDVYFNPDFKSSPRGLATREKLDCSILIADPSSDAPITRDAERNRTMAEYLKNEMELYKSGSDRAGDFGKIGKLWLELANPDGTINSAYGKLIWGEKDAGNHSFNGGLRMTQWEWARQALQKDQYSRQAILLFIRPAHQWQGDKDVPCTMHGNFTIRDGRLHFTVVMRSNDLVLGFPYDAPWFISLMDEMIKNLKEAYPNLRKGSYTHIAHNLHLYEKDASRVLRMLGE